jgi:hypothetical protein
VPKGPRRSGRSSWRQRSSFRRRSKSQGPSSSDCVYGVAGKLVLAPGVHHAVRPRVHLQRCATSAMMKMIAASTYPTRFSLGVA